MTPATSTISVNGPYFRDNATGARWHYVGLAASALFVRWLKRKSTDGIDGPTELVLPNLEEYRHYADVAGYTGDITLRVYRAAGEPQNNAFALDPWSYDRMTEVPAFTRFCNERGFRIDWTLGNARDIFPGEDGPLGQRQHINEFCAAMSLVGPTNFIEAANEPLQHANNYVNIFSVPIPRWGTYLRNSGYYYGGQWDQSTNLDFISLHPDRSSEAGVDKFATKHFESAPYLRAAGPAPVQNEMMGFDEVETPGRRTTNPEYAMLQGLGVAVTGVGFLASDGHACNGYRPKQAEACVRYFKGAAQGVEATR